MRSFIDGEIVFREGEAGDSAFVIKSGRVALTKETRRGPVEIDILDKGAFFGEVGVLNGGQRTLTATAIGDLLVEVADQKTFKNSKSRTAKTPSRALTTLGTPTQPADTTGSTSQSWFSRLFARPHHETVNIEVRIVPLIGEKGDRHARTIYDSLIPRKGLNVKIISSEGAFAQKAMSRDVMADCARDGRALLRKSGGDILIWGDVSIDQKVLHLHFTSSVPADEDLPGSMTGYDILPLPVVIPSDWSPFLHAMVLSATAPSSAGKVKTLKTHLETALEEGAPAAQKPPREFTSTDRALLTNCLAHALAVAGQRIEEPELLQMAEETYLRAINAMPEDEKLHLGLARKSLGSIQALNAERSHDIPRLRAAADSMRAAIEEISRRTMPQEWAAAQNRLGQILYRLHMSDAATDTGLLSEAIAAFHAAVQVYTRVDAPERWADIMNSHAQATQILGGQLNDPAILQKAVNACRNALEIRRRDRTPFLWAATQNTLGSALFLMGKMTNRVSHLESALDAFRAAHEIYTAHNTVKMARVTARNIEHVETLLLEDYSSEYYEPAQPDTDKPASQIDENWWRENVVDEREHMTLG